MLLGILYSCNIKNEKQFKMEKPFDLSKITFNENIYDILSITNLKVNDSIFKENSLLESTSLGYRDIVFNNEELLVFNDVSLYNSDINQPTSITFHFGEDTANEPFYNEQPNILGMYEINFRNKSKAELLLKTLKEKFGKPIFHKYNEGFESKIENNRISSTDKKTIFDIYSWRERDIVYFLYLRDSESNEGSFRFYVFNKEHNEWFENLSNKGYDHLIEVIGYESENRIK